MKKFLIGTSALISAALVASAAQAEDPKVMVGGIIDFQAGYVDDDFNGRRDYGFRNDTEISFTVHGHADNGLGYGAVIDLEADVSADVNGEGLNAAQTYVFLDGSFGRFEMGSTAGSSESLAVEADNIARGTGGINGDWFFFTGVGGGNFISTAALPVEHGSTAVAGDETFFNATKINYYSPRFSGFQVGASFTPDLDDAGQVVSRFDTIGGAVGSPAGYGDIFEAGVNYEGQWDEVGVAIAATGQIGDSDNAAREDLRAWNVGTALNIMGISLAGSYGDWDESSNTNGNEGDYYTLGAAYDFGPFGASVTWLDSTLETGGVDNDFENLSFGADYMLAPGMTPYAEVSLIDADAGGNGIDNDATVVILGTELAF